MASIPSPFKLTITAGDTMNYNGKNYVISSVAAGSDDNKGNITYAVTLTGGTVVTVSANNCVQESANNSSVVLWTQNASI